MTDYTKMDSAEMLHVLNDDGQKWAEAFCQHFQGKDLDQEMVFIWFANAIERSHDYRTGNIINGEHAQYLIDHGLER